MTSRSTYLTDRYPKDKGELQRAEHLLESALRLFSNTQATLEGQRGWPYSPGAEGPFSTSTNAMIAYAVAAAVGMVNDDSLLPLARPVKPFLESNDQVMAGLKTNVTEAIQSVWTRIKAKGSVVSSTYGQDDPLSLLWLHQTAHALVADQQSEPVQEVAVQLKAWVQKVTSAHYVVTDSSDDVTDSSDDPIRGSPPECRWLRTGSGTQQLDEVQGHPFLALRTAQLLSATGKNRRDSPALDSDYYRELFFQHLGYLQVADKPFDAAELTFALEGLIVAGDSPDERLYEAFFDVMRASQERSSYWRPLRPFLVTDQGLALLPLSVEIANSLLRICARAKKDFPERSLYGTAKLILVGGPQRMICGWCSTVKGSLSRRGTGELSMADRGRDRVGVKSPPLMTRKIPVLLLRGVRTTEAARRWSFGVKRCSLTVACWWRMAV